MANKYKIDILNSPLDRINIATDIVDILEYNTRCKLIGDLWQLSRKELCYLVGLNVYQVNELLDGMELVAKELPQRYMNHIARCRDMMNRDNGAIGIENMEKCIEERCIENDYSDDKDAAVLSQTVCEFDGIPVHPHFYHHLVKAGFRNISEIENVTESEFVRRIDAIYDNDKINPGNKCLKALKNKGVRFLDESDERIDLPDNMLEKPLNEYYDNSSRSPLYDIISTYNGVWNNLKRLKALLSDFYPNDKLQRNLLYACAEEHIPHDLKEAKTIRTGDIRRFAKRLTNSYGCEFCVAEETVKLWADALCVRVEETEKRRDANISMEKRK